MRSKIFQCDICDGTGKIIVKDNIKLCDIAYCPLCGSPIGEDYSDDDDDDDE